MQRKGFRNYPHPPVMYAHGKHGVFWIGRQPAYPRSGPLGTARRVLALGFDPSPSPRPLRRSRRASAAAAIIGPLGGALASPLPSVGPPLGPRPPPGGSSRPTQKRYAAGIELHRRCSGGCCVLRPAAAGRRPPQPFPRCARSGCPAARASRWSAPGPSACPASLGPPARVGAGGAPPRGASSLSLGCGVAWRSRPTRAAPQGMRGPVGHGPGWGNANACGAVVAAARPTRPLGSSNGPLPLSDTTACPGSQGRAATRWPCGPALTAVPRCGT